MYLSFKRCMDIIVATLAILLLSPIFLPITIILLFTGEHVVFYRQVRVGLNSKPFHLLKFATMLKNSMQMGLGATTVRNDPRITSVGKLLRSTKINELPQIFNVFLGDMSFVGPRPLPEASIAKYLPEVRQIISQNRPGITGIGSVIFRDEEALATKVNQLGGLPIEYYRNYIYPYKGALEVWYSKNQSFFVDAGILFLTVWYILFRNSDLAFRLFPSLPSKAVDLTERGIEQLFLQGKLTRQLK